MRPSSWLDAVQRRLGGPRVLALPLMRILAVGIGGAWLALAPAGAQGREAAAQLVAAFCVYSAVVITALALRPGPVLRLNVFVLLVDLAFAFALIVVTGGAGSALFLALLVIAGLQSYYYGIRRG